MHKQEPLYWTSDLDAGTGKIDHSSTYSNSWNYNGQASNNFVCFTQEFNTRIQTNGVARDIKFNPELTKDIIQLTDGNLFVQEIDVIEQYEREYFNRWINQEVEKGKPIELFEYNLENDRNTWFVGAYASYESVGRVVDYVEVLLERAGLKERHEGMVVDIENELYWGLIVER